MHSPRDHKPNNYNSNNHIPPSLSPAPNTTTILYNRRYSSPFSSTQRRMQEDSRNAHSDRFIPSRSTTNLEDAFDLIESGISTKSLSNKNESPNENQIIFNNLLRSELLDIPGNELSGSIKLTKSPGREPSISSNNSNHGNIFKYKGRNSSSGSDVMTSPSQRFSNDVQTRTIRRSLGSMTAVASPRGSSILKQPTRKISKVPYKILDAPSLQDDYYLNLVDWSSRNTLSVALGSSVYLWSACTSKVSKMCDFGPNDSVTSIAWSVLGNYISVGTNSGKIQIWDPVVCKVVRELSGHDSRVGTMAWNSSLIASGSRDRNIRLQDIRMSMDGSSHHDGSNGWMSSVGSSVGLERIAAIRNPLVNIQARFPLTESSDFPSSDPSMMMMLPEDSPLKRNLFEDFNDHVDFESLSHSTSFQLSGSRSLFTDDEPTQETDVEFTQSSSSQHMNLHDDALLHNPFVSIDSISQSTQNQSSVASDSAAFHPKPSSSPITSSEKLPPHVDTPTSSSHPRLLPMRRSFPLSSAGGETIFSSKYSNQSVRKSVGSVSSSIPSPLQSSSDRHHSSSGGVVCNLQGHKQEVCGLKWSFDEKMLASGGNDNKLFVWEPQHGKNDQPRCRFEDHTAAVKAVAWSPHQHGLLVSGGGTADKNIRFWNASSGLALHKVDTGSQVCNLMWSKNVNELVSTHGYSLNQIIVWKYPSMQKIATLTGHSLRVLYLAMSPDGHSIVTGAGDETLRFWNVFPPHRNHGGFSGALAPSTSDIR